MMSLQFGQGLPAVTKQILPQFSAVHQRRPEGEKSTYGTHQVDRFNKIEVHATGAEKAQLDVASDEINEATRKYFDARFNFFCNTGAFTEHEAELFATDATNPGRLVEVGFDFFRQTDIDFIAEFPQVEGAQDLLPALDNFEQAFINYQNLTGRFAAQLSE